MNELTIRLPDPVYERIWERARQIRRPVDAVIVESLQAIFLPETASAPGGVSESVARVRRWLAQQPATAVRPPVSLPQAEQQVLDQEFEDLLSAIHDRNRQIPIEEVVHDVTEASRQVRAG